MLAVVHYALEPNAVELRDIPVPEIEDDEVLLEVGAVSVCGSDVHQARNTFVAGPDAGRSRSRIRRRRGGGGSRSPGIQRG